MDTGFIGRHRAALIPERLPEAGAAAVAEPLHKGLGSGRVYTDGEKEAIAVAAVGLCLQERGAIGGGSREAGWEVKGKERRVESEAQRKIGWFSRKTKGVTCSGRSESAVPVLYRQGPFDSCKLWEETGHRTVWGLRKTDC